VQDQTADRAGLGIGVGRSNERLEPTRLDLGIVVQRDEELPARTRTGAIQRTRESELDAGRLDTRSAHALAQSLGLVVPGAIEEHDRLERHGSGSDGCESLQAALE
jgi:hypothetical protein